MRRDLLEYFDFVSYSLRSRSFAAFIRARSPLIYSFLKPRPYSAFSNRTSNCSSSSLTNPRVSVLNKTLDAQLHVGSRLLSGNSIRSTLSNFPHLLSVRSFHLHHYLLPYNPSVHIGNFPQRSLGHSYTPFLTSSTVSANSHTPTPTSNNLRTAYTMAKPLTDASSESSLTPPPDSVVSAKETVTAVKPATNDRKRKAETISRTKKNTAQNVESEDTPVAVEDSPRPKRRAAKKVKVEQIEDDINGSDADVKPSLRPKHGAVKKAIVEEEVFEEALDGNADEDTKVVSKTKTSVKKATKSTKKAQDKDGGHEDKPKKTTKSKIKPAKILPPIAERTQGIKLRIGAHVSIAGG